MGDWPGLRDRDPNRTPMAWSRAPNGGFSSAPDPLLVLPPITSPGFDYRVVNVEVQQQLSGSLLNWHHRMLTSRRLLPALRYGDMVMIESGHPSVLCYARSCQERSEGEETLPAMTVIVAANLSGHRRLHPARPQPVAGPSHARNALGLRVRPGEPGVVRLPPRLRLLLVAGGE